MQANMVQATITQPTNASVSSTGGVNWFTRLQIEFETSGAISVNDSLQIILNTLIQSVTRSDLSINLRRGTKGAL